MRCFSHRSETALPSTRCSRRIATFCSGLKKRRLISLIEGLFFQASSILASAHDFPIPSEAGHLENQTARQFAIEHFVDRELKATLGNKRVELGTPTHQRAGWGRGE